MPTVCGVTFRANNKVYSFSVGEGLDVKVDDYVIVETARGEELGRVAQAPHEIERREVVGDLKPVLRLATTAELLEAERYRMREEEAIAICRERVAASGLPMKVIGGEYSFDGSHLTFYFASEERVDFRALVRELARILKTRIELRQVGVRDEARVVGGIGRCGRSLCCATWLDTFAPVSIRMAKLQNLPLSPNEISGQCGRLLCCLNYEFPYYEEVAGRFPKVGKAVESPLGPAKVTYVSVLREKVELLLEDGTRVEMTAGQFSGAEPFERPEPDQHKRQQLSESLVRMGAEQRLGAEPSERQREPKPPVKESGQPEQRRRANPAGPVPTTGESAEKADGIAPSQRRSGGRRRSRRRSAPGQK